MTPTESLLKELEELEKLATPGPWIWDQEGWMDEDECHDTCPSHFNGLNSANDEPVISGCTYDKHNLRLPDAEFISASRITLPVLLQIIRTQREELERMAKVDVSLLSNELAAAWALRHWVFARDALSRCDEIAKGVTK